jgi:hypothetical protein
MHERRLRIDSPHQSFDCSVEEFTAMLDATNRRFTFPVAQCDRLDHSDNLEWTELINAELALLASLQRRERLSKLYASE